MVAGRTRVPSQTLGCHLVHKTAHTLASVHLLTTAGLQNTTNQIRDVLSFWVGSRISFHLIATQKKRFFNFFLMEITKRLFSNQKLSSSDSGQFFIFPETLGKFLQRSSGKAVVTETLDVVVWYLETVTVLWTCTAVLCPCAFRNNISQGKHNCNPHPAPPWEGLSLCSGMLVSFVAMMELWQKGFGYFCCLCPNSTQSTPTSAVGEFMGLDQNVSLSSLVTGSGLARIQMSFQYRHC